MIRKALWATLLTVCFVLPLKAQAENPNDILVIANRSVKQDTVTEAELREIFLKKRNNWSSGGRAIPIHAPDGSVLRNAFRNHIMGMSSYKEKEYWQQRKIKSGIMQPAEFSRILKAVYKLQGAVGYIYRSQYRKGVVKVLLVISMKK